MTGLINYLRKPFDLLYAYTSDETDQYGIYADTRSKDSLYSITSTQSDGSTYAAYQSERDERTFGTVQPRELDAFDCEDPRTCPDCQPISSD